MTADCVACGGTFTTFPSYIKRRPTGGYCSQACRRRQRVSQCRACRKPVAHPASHQRAYCSPACRKADQPARQQRALESRIDKSGACWLWTGATLPNGYGRMRFADGCDYVHRVAWRIYRGAIPDGLCVCHHCDHPRCVNPEHLFLGTHKDNTQDAIAKGRYYQHLFLGGRAPITTCCRGHVLSADNVYEHNGARNCKPCSRLRSAAYRQRKHLESYRRRSA